VYTHAHTNYEIAIEDYFTRFIFSDWLFRVGEGMRLLRKTVSAIMLSLLVISTLTSTFNIQSVKAEPTTRIVPDDYPSIQAAVNAANPGDTVIVRAGTYIENVDVNKDHLTIKSESGAELTIVQAANSDDNVFDVTADYASITGFTVQNATENYNAGICLGNGVDHCNISENIVRNNKCGISLLHTYYNNLLRNSIWNNEVGIHLCGSGYNNITKNELSNNLDGIVNAWMFGDPEWNRAIDNRIIGNNISHGRVGIYLRFAPRSYLRDNVITWHVWHFGIWGSQVSDFVQDIDTSNTLNGKPMYYLVNERDKVIDATTNAGYVGVVSSTNITVKDVTIDNIWQGGVLFVSTTQSKIENATLLSQSGGIVLRWSSNITIRRNKILAYVDLIASSNNEVTENDFPSTGTAIMVLGSNNHITKNNIKNCYLGISLRSSNNLVYLNNFLNNTENVRSPSSTNLWNSPEEITYTYNGKTYTNYLGNYWSDYSDVDVNNDGIWDHPYVIDENNKDRYPLVNPWTPTPTYVHGVDVSHHQGNISWSEVYGAGYRFAFVKASEGVGWMDSNFVTNMDNGGDAGLLMGAYHFARPDLGNDAQDEALYFVSVARNYLKGGYLRPALDLEVGSSLGKEALSNWVHTWMETVKNETGIEPIIYVNSNYANNYLNTSVAKYNLWVAHWTYDTNMTPNAGIWSSWDFWQYSNNGSVPGISGDVDLDIFNGDMSRLYNTFVIPENQPPIVHFDYYPVEPKAGEQVTFDASSSYDPDGEIMFYEWDWNGDGYYDEYTTFPVVTFWWAEKGSYNVTLSVTDNEGATNTAKQEITIRESAESKIILCGWGWNPLWTTVHWEDHCKFKSIDEWLRDNANSKKLSWLPPKFSKLEEPDIVDILNTEIDHDLAPGLTYMDYAINAICEAKLVDEAWRQPTAKLNIMMKPLVQYAFGSIWGLLVSEQQIIELVAKVSIEAGLTLAIGLPTMLMAKKILDIKNLVDLAMKEGYTLGLGRYFFNRWLYGDHETAWNDPDVQNAVCLSIKADATEEEKNRILRETSWYFDNLWMKYKADDYYDPGVVHATGFPQDLRNQIKTDLRNLLVSALEKNSYRLKNSVIIHVASPVELSVSDSQGRITGVLHGGIREEIPYSVYDDETKTIRIFNTTDSYYYTIVGTSAGTYKLEIISIENGQIINFTATDIPTSTTAIHQFTINWTALSEGEEGVTVNVDSNGDGVFEHTFTSDSELTQTEFLAQTAPPPLSVSISPLSASILVGQSVTFTSTVSGGYTPYSYQWFLNGNPVSGATSASWTFIPTSSGIYYVHLKVTDDKGNTAQSETARITVATVTVETATGTGVATFSTDLGTIEDLVAVSEAALPEAGKPNLTFPHGFFSFRIVSLTPGASVTVTITLPSNMAVGTQYWKYQTGKGWYQILIGDDDGDNVITIRLTDGGLGDGDGQANGVIVDPGGPGSPPPSPPVGGVWVPVNKFELLAPWISLALLMAVAVASVIYVKHRKKQRN
jgi:lysozyme